MAFTMESRSPTPGDVCVGWEHISSEGCLGVVSLRKVSGCRAGRGRWQLSVPGAKVVLPCTWLWGWDPLAAWVPLRAPACLGCCWSHS